MWKINCSSLHFGALQSWDEVPWKDRCLHCYACFIKIFFSTYIFHNRDISSERGPPTICCWLSGLYKKKCISESLTGMVQVFWYCKEKHCFGTMSCHYRPYMTCCSLGCYRFQIVLSVYCVPFQKLFIWCINPLHSFSCVNILPIVVLLHLPVMLW